MNITRITTIKSIQCIKSSIESIHTRSSQGKMGHSIQEKNTTRANPFSPKLLAPTQRQLPGYKPTQTPPTRQSTKDSFTPSSFLFFLSKLSLFLPQQNPVLNCRYSQWVTSQLSIFLGSILPEERDPLCSLLYIPAPSWTILNGWKLRLRKARGQTWGHRRPIYVELSYDTQKTHCLHLLLHSHVYRTWSKWRATVLTLTKDKTLSYLLYIHLFFLKKGWLWSTKMISTQWDSVWMGIPFTFLVAVM